MRLADAIIAKRGSNNDRQWFGAFTALAEDVARAECFELAPSVVEAIENVRHSKPSSIESALSFARMPYPSIWVEWQPMPFPWKRPASEAEPAPLRSGFLMQRGESSVDGWISWVFQRSDGMLYPLPMGVIFDWETDLYQRGLPITSGEIKHIMRETGIWKRFAANPVEIESARRLGTNVHPCIPRHMENFIRQTEFILTTEQKAAVRDATFRDLEGEPSFAQSFLIMINTKDLLEREKEDLKKQNKSRRRLGRHPLQEFSVTKISLRRRAEKIAAGATVTAADRERARQHLVRGHFKVRKTGVFWWSPFVRGNPDDAIPRARYAVSG